MCSKRAACNSRNSGSRYRSGSCTCNSFDSDGEKDYEKGGGKNGGVMTIRKEGREERGKAEGNGAASEEKRQRKGEARHELSFCGQWHREAMGTRGVKACVVFSRPLEDVLRLASSICLTEGNHRAEDRMRDQPNSRRCVRVRAESE